VTIEFDCPHCHRLLRTPDEKAGLLAECPSCGTPVTVPEGDPFETDDIFEEDIDSPQAPRPSGGSDFDDFFNTASEKAARHAPGESRRACPACGESIATAAQRCRFCSETFAPKPRRKLHRKKDSNLALFSMILGIISLPTVFYYCSGLPTAIGAIVVGNIASGHIKRGEANGKGMAATGIATGTISIVLAIAAVVGRLVFGFQLN
jgi:predicted RNA-binding Zn-ribbon protein involved in translation (DUF1610 family)